jgi:hypothetical protein
MKHAIWGAALFAGLTMGSQAFAAADTCTSVAGDVVLSARTPQVDLYDGANGKVVNTLDKDKFPSCTPVTGRAPNMMLKVTVNGTDYWVPPHMVNARLAGKGTPICRNLAMGDATTKVGSTRGLGEDCPKTTAPTQ